MASPSGSANGGIIGKTNNASFGKNKITTQTSTGNITLQPGTRFIGPTLIVAGGGSGGGGNPGASGAGGGGGGGLRTLSPVLAVCGPFSVTIGAGGAATATGPGAAFGTVGSDTSYSIDGTTYTASGGGYGSVNANPGGAGGSGGGASDAGTGGAANTPPQACNQGSAGGNGNQCGPSYGGGGGGGAGAVGSNGTAPAGAAGGAGVCVKGCYPNIRAVYSGGGGGATWATAPGPDGAGGSGGGGSGKTNGNANAGRPNSGGGGGGGNGCTISSGAGGSGVVIVKELNRASGVWSMQSQFQNQGEGAWPKRVAATVDFLVVGGGGGSGTGITGSPTTYSTGGGGAGGYRSSGYGPAPMQSSAIELYDLGDFTITVGAGGAAGHPLPPGSSALGTNSSFDTITSHGGGWNPAYSCGAAGSGQGAICGTASGSAGLGATGNVGGYDPPEGFPGAPYQDSATGGGGGGASGAATGVNGSNGLPNTISGADVTYAGGGGGAPGGSGGTGGGGDATTGPSPSGTATANTGGGGGGARMAGPGPNAPTNTGGSGIVIIRGPSAVTFAGSPCAASCISTRPAPEGSCKVAKFTDSGTLTIS